MNLVDTAQCQFCKETDTITHFFLKCPIVKAFWKSFLLWWNRLEEIIIPLDSEVLEETILFGFQIKDDILSVFNYCALYGKYYIYRQRLFYENKIDFYQYLIELKHKLKIEKMICHDYNTTTCTSFDKFVFLYEQL